MKMRSQRTLCNESAKLTCSSMVFGCTAGGGQVAEGHCVSGGSLCTRAFGQPAAGAKLIMHGVFETSWQTLRVGASVITWVTCSTTLILYNKYILAGFFPFPTVLTFVHMLFATLASQALRSMGYVTLPDISSSTYLQRIVPIAALFALSLILSNYAYLYISVSFIQMLKASTPMAVLMLSFAAGLRSPSWTLAGIVLMVCSGVALAAYGELQFSRLGVMLQMVGVLTEASRLVVLQLAMKEISLNPMGSVTLYAPACAIVLFAISFTTGEAQQALAVEWQPWILLSNAALALMLNIATLWLVQETSSLVLTLCGVFKDILLIFLSKQLFMSPVTSLQTIGYGISLLGIHLFHSSTVTTPSASPSLPTLPVPTKSSGIAYRHIIFGISLAVFLVVGLYFSDQQSLLRFSAIPIGTQQMDGASATTTSLLTQLPTISTVILTSQKTHNTRLKAVLNTWGKHANISFIASDHVDVQVSPLLKRFEEGKDNLARKVLKAWVEQCQYSADWHVMTDDDTFMIIPNLLSVLAHKYNSSEAWYIGYTLNHMTPALVGGGGGILLSNQTMLQLCKAAKESTPCNPNSHNVGAGDVATAFCMQHLGVFATHQDGFHPFTPQYMIADGCKVSWIPKYHKCPPVPLAISFHYVPPEEFPALYYLTYTYIRA